jgi:hypothetical protein
MKEINKMKNSASSENSLHHFGEEFGEVARGVMREEENLIIEIIQTAAVCVAWLETIDRKDYKAIDLCQYWEAKRAGLMPHLPKVSRDIVRNEK